MVSEIKLRPLHFFIPFEAVERGEGKHKLDEDWVPGYAFVNEVVRGEGGVRLKRSAMEKASDAWFKAWGNVREMHDKRAAGVVRHSEWDDVGWFVASEIVDPIAKLKCQRGVYKGYSVGVRPTAVDPQHELDVTECEIVELSLVDRPKDPDALFVFRAEGYDPGLATAVEVRRLPGHSSLDTPEAISTGSTYYGEEPIKEGDLAIVAEGDHFCLYGPDGQKLGEFPTLEEARERARKVNEVTKPAGALSGAPESPIGGPVQDQNAGPVMHSPIPGPEEKRVAALKLGEAFDVQRDSAAGLWKALREKTGEVLFEAETVEELGAIAQRTLIKPSASPSLPSDEQPFRDAKNMLAQRGASPPPLTYGLREGNTGWYVEVKSAGGRERLIGAFQGRPEAEGAMLILARISKQDDIPLEDFDRAVDEVLARAQTALSVPSRENLEGKGGKVERDKGEMDGAGDEADDAADDEEKRKKKAAKAIEDAVKEKEKRAKEREKAAEDGKEDPEEAKERVVTVGPHREPIKVGLHNSEVTRLVNPDGTGALWQIKTADMDIKQELHYWGRYQSEEEAQTALEKASEYGFLVSRQRAVTVTDATPDLTMAGLPAPPKEKAFTDGQQRAFPEESVAYADDANMKWPLDTEVNIRAAWDHVTTELSGKQYSNTELAAMKSKIKAAAMSKGFALGDSAAGPDDEKRAAAGEAQIERIVVEEDGKWLVMSHDGKKKLGGPYKSKDEAEARLREIEYFKGAKREGERGDGSPDEHHLAQSHRGEGLTDPTDQDRLVRAKQQRSADIERVDDFWCRLTRFEDQNCELITRLEVAETEIARAAEAEGELKRLLATREAEITRLSALPAYIPEERRPALYTALPREFFVNRQRETEQKIADIDKLIEEVTALPPTSDPAEQNRRAQTVMNLKVARQGVPGE